MALLADYLCREGNNVPLPRHNNAAICTLQTSLCALSLNFDGRESIVTRYFFYLCLNAMSLSPLAMVKHQKT